MCLFAESVSTPPGSLPTVGGVPIIVTGLWLGRNASVVVLEYTGGLPDEAMHTYASNKCSILVPNTKISCLAVPGVGGEYVFRVIVDGGASDFSDTTLSYAEPTITSLSGPGAVAADAMVSARGVICWGLHVCVLDCLGDCVCVLAAGWGGGDDQGHKFWGNWRRCKCIGMEPANIFHAFLVI